MGVHLSRLNGGRHCDFGFRGNKYDKVEPFNKDSRSRVSNLSVYTLRKPESLRRGLWKVVKNNAEESKAPFIFCQCIWPSIELFMT
jgi:hypothetical protein